MPRLLEDLTINRGRKYELVSVSDVLLLFWLKLAAKTHLLLPMPDVWCHTSHPTIFPDALHCICCFRKVWSFKLWFISPFVLHCWSNPVGTFEPNFLPPHSFLPLIVLWMHNRISVRHDRMKLFWITPFVTVGWFPASIKSFFCPLEDTVKAFINGRLKQNSNMCECTATVECGIF